MATGACGSASNMFDKNEGGLFSKPLELFAKPDWATASDTTIELGPRKPISPNDLVNADGSCPPPEAAAAAPAAGAPAEAGVPPVLGGIALGMTECQAVNRAGAPGNVSIGADEKGERKVVLTYQSGPWPGVYTFSAGRLKMVERLPEAARPAPRKKQPAKPRVSQSR